MGFLSFANVAETNSAWLCVTAGGLWALLLENVCQLHSRVWDINSVDHMRTGGQEGFCSLLPIHSAAPERKDSRVTPIYTDVSVAYLCFRFCAFL